MRTSQWTVLLVALAVVVSATAARAEGWGVPSLWPFNNHSQKKPAPRASSPSWPNPLTTITNGTRDVLVGTGDAIKTGGEKLSSGTRQVLTKTYDVLTPWDNAPKRQPPPSATGVRRTVPRDEPASRSSLTSWLFPEPAPPKRPQTMSDWVSQDRPKF